MKLTHINTWFPLLIIATGLCLRLAWNSDMEWKDDEKLMFELANAAVAAGRVPDIGMMSGGGVVNPGLSVAPFAFFATFTDTPEAMNRMVQITNIVALLMYLVFVLTLVPPGERTIWLYALALMAVSPQPVIYSRKIWAQDIIPFVSFFVILSNYFRRYRLGAFFWGLTGALIGQFHMSGFFFAAGLFAFTVVYDLYHGRRVRWISWTVGSVLGTLPMIAWVMYMMNNPTPSKLSIWHVLQFNFFLYWFYDMHGLNLYYFLGNHFWEYLKEPVLGGVPTFLAAAAHLVMLSSAVYTLYRIIKYLKEIFQNFRRKTAGNWWLNFSTDSRFYLSAMLTFGVLMTISGVVICPHYLICAIPFQYLLLVKLFAHQMQRLRWIMICQMVATACFLLYIHTHGGAPEGDYGVAYSWQGNR